MIATTPRYNRPERSRGCRAIVIAALASGTLIGSAGCGDAGSESADVEARVARERADAARQARQDERLKTLKREVEQLKKGNRSNRTTTVIERARRTGTSTRTESGSWPSGACAWTVVLRSSTSKSEAEVAAARANESGLPDVGTLLSSEHTSLRAGYWVAYSGVLSRADATARQREARAAGFSDAYARYVSTP